VQVGEAPTEADFSTDICGCVRWCVRLAGSLWFAIKPALKLQAGYKQAAVFLFNPTQTQD
jgi:hypothetical protein